MPFRSFISSLCAALPRRFMSSSPTTDPPFLTPPEDEISTLYAAKMFLRDTGNRAFANSSTITRAAFLKDSDISSHELILFLVVLDDSSTTCIKVERTGVADGEGEDGSSVSSPTSSAISVGTLSKDKIRAKDVIDVPGNATRAKSFEERLEQLGTTHRLLSTMTFSHAPSISQLIVLLDVIHAQGPHYVLLKSQCYWLAGMLWETLRQEFGGTVSNSEHQNKAGRFGSLPIITSKPDTIRTSRTNYTIAWRTFCEQYPNGGGETRNDAEEVARERARRVAAEERVARVEEDRNRERQLVEEERREYQNEIALLKQRFGLHA